MDEITHGVEHNLSEESYPTDIYQDQDDPNDSNQKTNSESTLTNTFQCNSDDQKLVSPNISGVGKSKRPRKARSIFSPEQLKLLNDEFDRHNYINNYTREELASRAGISPEQVKIWFQNMRSKRRKSNEKSRHSFFGVDVVPNQLHVHPNNYNELIGAPQIFHHPNFYPNNDYSLIGHNSNNYSGNSNYPKINRPPPNSFVWENSYQTSPYKVNKNNIVVPQVNIPFVCNQSQNHNSSDEKNQKSSKTSHSFVAPGFASTLYNAKLHNMKKGDNNFAVPSNKPVNCFKPNVENSCNIPPSQLKKGFSSSTPQRNSAFHNPNHPLYNHSMNNYPPKSKIPIPNYPQDHAYP